MIIIIDQKRDPDPITYNRSSDNSIGTIFGTPNFKMTRDEFLPFGQLESDHMIL